MRLAILLATADEADARDVTGLAAAAKARGHDVYLFLTGDGTRLAGALAPLSTRGVSVAGCSHSARGFGLPQIGEVAWGNQMDWAQAASDADRVIVLG